LHITNALIQHQVIPVPVVKLLTYETFSLVSCAKAFPYPLLNNRDQNTIRVTNISEDTTEADLQELFQPFGRISRVYLAKDKETMQSRGFAFVSFVHREDAARAMDKLQGHGYDHLILKLEWARPSAPKGDPGSSGTVFRSGYGKALAQDTKEKVSYASNLTTGTGIR
jgi:translation initiation factor 3 subunit G